MASREYWARACVARGPAAADADRVQYTDRTAGGRYLVDPAGCGRASHDPGWHRVVRVWPVRVAVACRERASRRDGGLGARLLSRRSQRLIASILLPVAVAALLAAWFGTFLAGRVTLLTVLFAIAFAAATAFFLLVMVVAASGAAQLGVMALVGAFTATFALPEL